MARGQTQDLDEAAAIVKEEAERHLEGALGERAIRRMERTTSYWMNTWGYMRYMDKAESG
jgi:hypothetical protein